jgi:dipeptidyl aminopeptidase/acylaminoacyl peptidase
MKFHRKRAYTALVLALMLALLPFAGCDMAIHSLERALLGATAAPYPAHTPVPEETPPAEEAWTAAPFDTPEAARTPAAGQTPGAKTPAPGEQWSQWQADAEKKLPAPIPLDVLFSAPEYISPTVSGDGQSVLYRHISPHGSDDIVVRNMKTGAETVVPYPAEGIPHFMWSADSKHVLFMVDRSGNENYGIYSVDIATGKSKTVFSGEGVSAIVLSNDDDDPDTVYYEANARDPQLFDLYKYSLSSGKSQLVLQNPGDITGWDFDSQGNFRIVETTDGEGGEHVLLRKPGASRGTAFVQSDWREVLYWDYDDTDTSGLICLSVDGKRIFYRDSTGRNTAAVMEMDLDTGKATLVDSDPDYDVSDVWIDLEQDRVTAVEYYGERGEWKALEPGIGAQFDIVRKLNPGDFYFTSSSNDDRYWLIGFGNDTDSGAYYYVDSQTGASTFLFNANPALENYEYAKMEPMEYTASDGLKIRGYITFPAGLERKGLPMVLLVHGGPQARDAWGFNVETQWLANRGYMVLQVNFRGSTGYGKQFVLAGDREWGGKMQQDLTDAVNWAVSNGYADRSRIAIMGASYGGYAALAGAAFTPDVYACAIDMFGPSNLETLVENSPQYWRPQIEQLYRSIGDPGKDEAFMRSRSPLFSVDNIKIPILIAQGGNDVRVTPQESEQIVGAMQEKGLYVDYMFFPNAGHGFNMTKDYLSFYTEAENFLSKYIGGRAS